MNNEVLYENRSGREKGGLLLWDYFKYSVGLATPRTIIKVVGVNDLIFFMYSCFYS